MYTTPENKHAEMLSIKANDKSKRYNDKSKIFFHIHKYPHKFGFLSILALFLVMNPIEQLSNILFSPCIKYPEHILDAYQPRPRPWE